MDKSSTLKEEILNRYSESKEDKIFIISRKYRMPFHEAEDIYQKAFLKALKNADKFRGESSVKTWLYRIIHNCALDYLRSIKNKRPVELINDEGQPIVADLPDSKPNPLEEISRRESVGHVRLKIEKAKSKRSPMHKMTFELAFEKNHTYEQIAKHLKCSKGTVMSRIFYARKNFQRHFTGQTILK